MTTSMMMEMNLGENGGAKQQSGVNGGGGGRRRTKGRPELNPKKNKMCQRGMGVEQLERLRLQEGWRKMTELPSLHPFTLPAFNSSVPFPTPACSSSAAVQFRPVQAATTPTPPMVYHGIGIHGTSLYSTDHVMDIPSVIGSGNVGFRFENSKELSSIQSYVNCPSDGCGVCHKKKRVHGGGNVCSVNPFRNLAGNNAVVEMIDAAKARRCSGQVTEVMSVHRSSGGSAMTEYEFFPGKGGRSSDDYKEFMRYGTTTALWCGSGGGTSVGGGASTTGLHGGDRSCVTALTGNEEGSVSSVDLSLKL